MRVLVPVDGGLDCRKAIEFLCARQNWLEESKAEVELLYVQKPYIEHPMEIGDFDLQVYYDEKTKETFDRMADVLKKVTFKYTKKVLIGHPAKLIPEYASEHNVDLIVMGARGLTPIKNLYLGSVSLGVLARAKCPVMICRYAGEEPTRMDGWRVGISVDGSAFGPRSADVVAHHLGFFGKDASFEVINVADSDRTLPLELVDKGVLEIDKELPELDKKEFEEATRDTLAKFKEYNIAVKPVFLQGKLHKSLVEYAEKNLDMLVMGTHGRGALSSLVFGSSTRAVIAATRLPLLIIPKKD
ncbi:MAG TPA: universal stress protein [Candidatus Aphodousia gallistercoris]|nr:universal stress protein [Candidatus Aphodousia gallistercoris]